MNFTGTKPLFIQLADYYQGLIQLGVYKEGDMLPSVREIALTENINPNTVAHSFALLCERKVVESIPKKGYFVLKQNQNKKVEQLKDIFSRLLEQGYSLADLEEAIKIMKEDKKHD